MRDIRKINSQFLLGLIKTGDILVKQHVIEILMLIVNHELEEKAAKYLHLDIKMQYAVAERNITEAWHAG